MNFTRIASTSLVMGIAVLAANRSTAAPGSTQPASPATPNHAPTLVAKDALGVVGDIAKLRAAVTLANGRPGANVEIRFFVGKEEVGKAITGAEGAAELAYVIPDTLKAGATPYEARIAASGPFANAQGFTVAKANLAVMKAKTTMPKLEIKQYPPEPLAKEGANKLIVNGLLGYGTKNMVSGRPIKVSLGSRQVTVTTSVAKTGKTESVEGGSFSATLDLSLAELGKTFPITVAFEGDDQFLPYVRPAENFQIRGVADLVYDFYGWPETHDPQMRLGESVDIVVRMRRNEGLKPAPGVKVKVWAVGLNTATNLSNIGEGVTDASGRATIHYKHTSPVPSGLYHMWVAYENVGTWVSGLCAPDPNYVRGNLKIEPTPLKLEVKAPPSATVGELVKISTNLYRAADKVPVANRMWIFKVGEIGTNELILENQPEPLAQGTYTIKITPDMGPEKQRFVAIAMQPNKSAYIQPQTEFEIAIASPSKRDAALTK